MIVVGAGAAGMVAAWRAAQDTRHVLLLEKNGVLGRKLSLTGKGRGNLTNDSSLDTHIGAFGKQGVFLRNAYSRFFVPELKAFFSVLGVPLATQRQARVFPANEDVRSVIEALGRALRTAGVEVRTRASVREIAAPAAGPKRVVLEDGRVLEARAVIIATGGASYPATGSTGDGYRFAGALGHEIVPPQPALVPLRTRERWVRSCAGLVLFPVRLTFTAAGRARTTDVGELLLTHFGVSGPLVLNESGRVAGELKSGPVTLAIDLKPGLEAAQLDDKLRRAFAAGGGKTLKNFLAGLLPKRLIGAFLSAAGLDGEKKCHQVTVAERRRLIAMLKALPLTVTGTLGLEEAMVTQGGVALKEIDPRTMASRKAPGVYLCGEVLDLAAVTGGFNLQAAFSTGYLAGEAAGKS
ncbi:MAG: NAD(P)/FAD-dependent oxidoreductase [Deltaproteobacteria bacterium]